MKRAPRTSSQGLGPHAQPYPASFKVDWDGVWATIQSPWLTAAAQRHTCWAALQNGLFVGARLGRIFQASPLCGLCEIVSPVPCVRVATFSHLFNLYTSLVFAGGLPHVHLGVSSNQPWGATFSLDPRLHHHHSLGGWRPAASAGLPLHPPRGMEGAQPEVPWVLPPHKRI